MEIRYKEYYEIDSGNGLEVFQNQGFLPPTLEYVFSKFGEGPRWTLHLAKEIIENDEIKIIHLENVRQIMQ